MVGYGGVKMKDLLWIGVGWIMVVGKLDKVDVWGE